MLFGLFNEDLVGLFGVALCLISDAGGFLENGGLEVDLPFLDFGDLVFLVFINTFAIGSFFGKPETFGEVGHELDEAFVIFLVHIFQQGVVLHPDQSWGVDRGFLRERLHHGFLLSQNIP